MIDACASNALDSAAFVDVCNRFSIVHSFSSRLFVVHCCQDLPMQQFNGMSYDSRRRSSVFISENSFSTSATYAAMSISASRWRLKNSVINRLSRLILLCSLTLTSMSQMSVASLYVNTKSATGLTQRTRDQRRRPSIIPLPRQQIFLIFRRLFIVRYIGTLPRSVNNRHPLILFEVHVHLPFPLGPTRCTNKLFDFLF